MYNHLTSLTSDNCPHPATMFLQTLVTLTPRTCFKIYDFLYILYPCMTLYESVALKPKRHIKRIDLTVVNIKIMN